jgi:hypothetical protein
MYDGPEPQWERDFELEKLPEAGLFRLRASIDWPDVEPSQDDWHFEATDPLVAMVTEAGLRFDGRLCYGVDWARPPGDDSSIRPEDFGDYAGAVAAHYCGKIDSYEIWNEENLDIFWKPEPDPDRYGRILKAACTAVHEACPGARVVFGGLSCFDFDRPADPMYSFIERVHLFHPDIADSFDALAIHPYTFLQTTSPEWTLAINGREVWPGMQGQIRTARRRLEAIGAGDKPIWLTEWGWPSLLIGPQLQAAYFARGALTAVAEGVEALHWYTFWDGDGTRSPPTEDFFGLFTNPRGEGGPREKPVFRVACTLSRILSNSRFAGDLKTSLGLPDTVYGLAFLEEPTGRITFAGWDASTGPFREVRLPCPAGTGSYRCVTDEGEFVTDGPCPGEVTIRLTERVLYVQFDRP